MLCLSCSQIYHKLQELPSAHQTAVTELTTCFGEDLPASLPGWATSLHQCPNLALKILQDESLGWMVEVEWLPPQQSPPSQQRQTAPPR